MRVQTLPMLLQPCKFQEFMEILNPKSRCAVCSCFGCILQSHKHFAEVSQFKKVTREVPPSTPKSQIVVPVNTNLVLRTPPSNGLTYPIAMNAERLKLLENWYRPFGNELETFQRHLYPIKFIDCVLPVALKHAVLFQGLLALSAILSSQANGGLDDNAIRHQESAAQLLSQTCPDEASSVTDEWILAGLHQIIMQFLLGNTQEASRQLSNINKVVMLRGGPHYLGLRGLVSETLLYVDYLHAAFLDRPILWEMPLPSLDLGPTTTLGSGYADLLLFGLLNAQVVQAANAISRLTEVFKMDITRPLVLKHVNATGYLSNVGEYQLTRCAHGLQSVADVNKCVSLALLLYNHVILRNHGSISPFIRRLEYQFWTTFEMSEVTGQWAPGHGELLLWTLFTGLIVEIRSDCRWKSLAMSRLKELAETIPDKSWDAIRQILNKFCWLPSAQEETYQQIWLKMNR